MRYDKSPPFPPEEFLTVRYEELLGFVSSVFSRLGVPDEDARVVAENLVAADLRGIESHGVARLRRYVEGIRRGAVKVRPNIRVVSEGPSFALVDGDSGLGQVVGSFSMRLAIRKARESGLGFVTVRMSNHYGIAGYYAMMALDHDMIGVSMTNSRPLVAHTGALGKWLGTNPIAVAAPTVRPPPFVLDMATSVAPIGKMEEYSRLRRKVPLGWGIDSQGRPCDDPDVIMREGALLPLGGLGEVFGGHKGYGLALMVEIFTSVLSGAAMLREVGQTEAPRPANVGHFFMAIDISRFMPVEEFKERMERLREALKGAPLHPEFERIWIHGEKSYLTSLRRMEEGIPVHRRVFEEMRQIALEVGVEFPWEA
ncbi:MAG: Ldh family oxidoreductase [Candidatus Korarchaeota archaeon NZ13-K]|nr:MAG: Ldh family oxidoreductase [Candidatus Korarchaeota archaeon NZ13-K]